MAASRVMLRTSRILIEEDGIARVRIFGERTDRRQGILVGGSSEVVELLGGAMREESEGCK
jgi:hypothetical protein